jgi:hypothetical protein
MPAATSGAHSGDMFTHPEFTITLANQRTQNLLDEASSNRLARLARRSRRNRRSSPDLVIDLRERTSAPPATERAHLAA